VRSANPTSLGMATSMTLIEKVKESNESLQVDNINARTNMGLKGKVQQLVDSKPIMFFMKGTPI